MDDLLDFARLRDHVRTNLEMFQHRATTFSAAAERRAAVGVTVYENRGTPHLLIIKRSPRGSNPGQWALPGGHIDEGETAPEAVLRELEEETGLRASADNILGTLDVFEAARGISILPFVIFVPGSQRPIRNPDEVHSIHPVAVSTLLRPGVPRWKTIGEKRLLQMPLRHDMVVHAPTGAILNQFAEVGLRGRPVTVAEMEEPEFTSR